MVGVEDFEEVSKEQMEWLKNGGRNRIERMAKRFMKIWEKAGRSGDFYVSIDLPSDILVVARRKGAIAYCVWKFDYNKMELAQKTYEQIKEHYADLETLTITNLKDYFSLESDLIIITDVSWHGEDAYWQGWITAAQSSQLSLFPTDFEGVQKMTEDNLGNRLLEVVVHND